MDAGHRLCPAALSVSHCSNCAVLTSYKNQDVPDQPDDRDPSTALLTLSHQFMLELPFVKSRMATVK